MSSPSFFIQSKRGFLSLTIISFLLCNATAFAALVQPDTVNASSEHSAPYVALNTINGSGLPVGFDASDAHADYTLGNHWTTPGATVPTEQHITWGFNSPTTLGGIYIWNHRSNNIASNSGYEPILFDLTFFDAAMTVLRVLDDIDLAPDVATGQTLGIGGLIDNVSFVRFDIEAVQSSSNFTGLAEVAFDTSVVPIPAPIILLGSALASLVWFKRRAA